jgi:hypothetical protein
MATVRILSWNIFKFGKKVVNATTRVNIILDLVNPTAGPNFDVFVVIEPVCGNGKVAELAKGDGPDGMVLLKAALRGRSSADWQVVPPVVLANATTREAMAVFYDAGKVKLKGPVDDTNITSATWRTTKTKGAGPGTLRGKCEFVNGSDTKLGFPVGSERRPYLVTFETVSGNKEFSILAAHSPSPSYTGSTEAARNRQARKGTQALGKIKDLLETERTHPIIVVSDTNCCHPGHPTDEDDDDLGCSANAEDEDEKAREDLESEHFVSKIDDGGTSLKTVDGSTTTAEAYRNHAFDYLLVAGSGSTPPTVTNAKIYKLGDLTTGFLTTLNKTKFKPIFKRVRTTAGKGVSDHLPIGATVTV